MFDTYTHSVVMQKQIAGISHDGAAYCVECAKNKKEINVKQALEDDSRMAWTSVILKSHEWDYQPVCNECLDELDVNNVFE